MRRSNPLLGLLFLLVIGVALVAGYVVASSVRIGPVRPPDILSRLTTPTPTTGQIAARLVTPVATGEQAVVTPGAWPTPVQPTERPAPTVVVPTFPPASVSTPTATATRPGDQGTLTPEVTGTAETLAHSHPTGLSVHAGRFSRDARGPGLLRGGHIRLRL